MPRSTSDLSSQLPRFRLVDSGWASELLDGVRVSAGRLRIVCPFIKERALNRLLELHPKQVRVITRFNLAEFADGVSDIAALRNLLESGAVIRGIRNLHAKVYLFGARRAIVTSANLTEGGLSHNPEFGVVTSDPAAIQACRKYFDLLWRHAGDDLSLDQLLTWDREVTRYLASRHGLEVTSELNDYGVDAGFDEPLRGGSSNLFGEAPQAFVKLIGESHSRPPISLSTLEEIRDSCCEAASWKGVATWNRWHGTCPAWCSSACSRSWWQRSPMPRVPTGCPMSRSAALIFLYRLLFVLYAEDRGLLPVNDPRYDDYGLRKRGREDVARRMAEGDTFAATVGHYYNRLIELFRQIDHGDESIRATALPWGPVRTGGRADPGSDPDHPGHGGGRPHLQPQPYGGRPGGQRHTPFRELPRHVGATIGLHLRAPAGTRTHATRRGHCGDPIPTPARTSAVSTLRRNWSI